MVNYLIDFENVHESGLYGIRELDEEDQVFIFYSDQDNMLNLDTVCDVKARIHFFKTQQGKESLDKQLLTWMGYMIGKEHDRETAYVIVSYDKGYGNAANFWCEKYGFVKVRCQGWIKVVGESDHVFDLSSPEERKYLIGRRICEIAKKYGIDYGSRGLHLNFSKLCSCLHGYEAYDLDLKATGKKPLNYFESELKDIVSVYTDKKILWAYTEPAVLQKYDTQNEPITSHHEELENGQDEVSEPENQDLPESEKSSGAKLDNIRDINVEHEENSNQKVQVDQDNSNGQKNARVRSKAKLKPQMAWQICLMLEKTELDRESLWEVSKMTELCLGENKPKEMLYRTLRHRYGIVRGTNVYRIVSGNVDINRLASGQ